jgi:four helix bundle protein
MSIALKEANETLYWLDLLKDTHFLEVDSHQKLHFTCKELVAMLASSVKTSKSNL